MISESCITKSAFAGVAGCALGGVFGLISASFTLENSFAKTREQIIAEEKLTGREKVREYFRETKNRCVSMGKNFGQVGALYTIFECTLEKVRAKKDIQGSMIAGCLAGATLARNTGISGMAFGCATFSAFSGVIDWWTEYH